MSKIKYYHENGLLFKVNINIHEVCSDNAIYKRSIKNIEMKIYSKNKKLVSINFDNGFWMPSQSKFFLKSKQRLAKGCFDGTNSLTINLKSNIINSINGHYLNLESGKNHNINCSSLKNI